MQIQILRLSIAAAVLVCSCANSQSIPSRAGAERMAPQQLARMLLGDERAARVVDARIGGAPGPRLDLVLLQEAPELLPDGLCARQTYVVRLSPPGAQAGLGTEGRQERVESIRESRWLGVAGDQGCSENVAFVEPRGTGEAELADVLKRLVVVRSIAASSRPLPFSVECSEEPIGPAACEGGGRTALATLPLERVTDISPIYDTSCVRIVFSGPKTSCVRPREDGKRNIVAWKVELAHAAGRGMTWFVGLAPKDDVQAVELKRVMVQYE